MLAMLKSTPDKASRAKERLMLSDHTRSSIARQSVTPAVPDPVLQASGMLPPYPPMSALLKSAAGAGHASAFQTRVRLVALLCNAAQTCHAVQTCNAAHTCNAVHTCSDYDTVKGGPSI